MTFLFSFFFLNGSDNFYPKKIKLEKVQKCSRLPVGTQLLKQTRTGATFRPQQLLFT
jgi:hypothetical protein